MRAAAVYLCVHVPEFPAQAMLRLRAEMRGMAVAVVEGVAPLERVCSVNRRAAVMGVRGGMTRAELDSFAGLAVLRRSAVEEGAAKAVVMEVAGGFTPRVEEHTAGLHGTAGACVVVLDVSGTERLFGRVEGLARRVVGALRELGLVARVAVSGNLLTAVVVARAMAVGGSVRVVEAGKQAEVLGAMPIGALQLTEAQAETFGAWGLQRVGELAALAETDVVVRMGQEGAALWRLACGRAEHLMVPVEEGLVLEEVMEFDAAVEGMESLMFVMGPMLDQLIARAGQRALELASVTMALGLDRRSGGTEGEGAEGPGGEHVRVLKPALPVADRSLLLKLLHLDLEAHPPGAGVVRVRVTAEAGRRGKVQTGLFSPPLPEPDRLEVTLARLAGMVGEQWVGRARLLDTHAPGGFVMERFCLPERSADKRVGRGRARKDRQQWQREEMERRLRERAACVEGGAGKAGSGVRALSVAEDVNAAGTERVMDAERRSCRVTTIRIATSSPMEDSGEFPGAQVVEALDVRSEEHFRARRAGGSRFAVPPGAASERENFALCSSTAKLVGASVPDAAGEVATPELAARSKVLHFAMVRPGAWSENPGECETGGEGVESARMDGVVEEAGPRCAVSVRRMRPPVPVRWKGERLTAFWMEGELYRVRERYGPWRLSGAWWTGMVWSQEEWDMAIEAKGGVRLLCVLTHDLLRDRWHVEAVYD